MQKDMAGWHEAIDDWTASLKDCPPGAPWEADIRGTTEQVVDTQAQPNRAADELGIARAR